MVKFISTIVALFSLLISPASVAFMTVTASIDKNPVIVNESFVLTVIADDDVNTNALDTSPLMQNFVVGRTSVSSQTSMINFKTSRTTQWTTVLIARKPGKIIIPPLMVEQQQTQPIELTVLAASDPQANKQQDLFIISEISAKEVYVQQQLTLTVKLHFAAELKRGSLTEPVLEGANIIQIGKDQEGDTIINGRRYRVIERTYAISPQQSGQFTLKSPVFSGEIMMPSAHRNSFLSFGESKPVSVIGDEIALNIRPIPTNYQGMWLPSELLSIHQEWQPDIKQFKVGEPITRVITLTAAGLSEEQLPQINMQMPDGLKVYPDQAELHTGMNSGRLVSQKVRNFAIVANKAGSYQLPEISIPWWNTVTNKLEHAIIPSQTIVVSANKDQANVQALPLPSQQPVTAAQPQTVIVERTSWLQWLFLALWLLTCCAWLLTHLLRNKSANSAQTSKPHVNDNYLALLAACKQNDAAQVVKLVVPWFNSVCDKPISTLGQIVAHCQSPELIEAITELQQNCYGQQAATWQGNKMLKAISAINKGQFSPSQRNSFALNP